MRRLLPVLFVLAAGLPTPVTAQTADLQFTEIYPDPSDGAREFIEILNNGNTTRQLQGYAVEDAAGNRYTFDAWELAPGQRVVVWGGGTSDALGPAWSRAAVWNNGGDTATLLAPDGSVVDRFAYGVDPAAPPPGDSLAWVDGAWKASDPTPGAGPDAESAQATVTVENAPPAAVLQAPKRIKPDAAVLVQVHIADPNGDQDVAGWRIVADGTLLAEGDQATAEVELLAPTDHGAWHLHLEAWDSAGGEGSSRTTIQVRDKDLYVALAQNRTLPFPPLVPGARNVASAESFSVHNDGAVTLEAVIDFSPFSAAGATIPVDGNLRLGITPTGSDVQEWIVYAGPMTPLPPLAPGGSMSVVVEIQEIPSPLPAGQYGTTFTVTP